MPQRGVACHFE